MRKTRNIIRYLVVMIINGIVMILFHSYANFLLLIMMLVFPFYSIYGVQKVSHFLMHGPFEPMEKGEAFYLHFVLENPTWHPLINATIKIKTANRFYQEEGGHELNLPVRAKQTTEVDYRVVMDYCGCLSVQAEQIRLMDLLGIYEIVVPLKEEQECLVVPKGELRNQEAGQIYLKGVTEAMESREKGYDFSEVSGIREYIPGDKLQNIHWKLSVKKDELMVKERISVSAMQLNVLVELANDEEMRLESVLELADSITKSFVAQNLPFTVWYYSTNLGELTDCFIGNEIERKQWLEMLLYNQSYGDCSMAEEMYQRRNGSGGSYLYIGYLEEAEGTEQVIMGNRQVAAVLKQ